MQPAPRTEPLTWSISVVSHGHGEAVLQVLLGAHAQLREVPHELILTLNIGEDTAFLDRLPPSLLQRLRLIRNPNPQGFGSNHNAALRDSRAKFVAMADPDLALTEPVFGHLETALCDSDVGIAAPLARASSGSPEDNGRALPTPSAIWRRQIAGRAADARATEGAERSSVDWLAGLFLAMRGETFHRLGGFDERYWMYCEDVDLCLRARQLGLSAVLLGNISVQHDARRKTMKSPRHFFWHVRSLWRLWHSKAYADALNHRAPH